MNPKLMRCNNPIGFVNGNKKGYCKNRGIVRTIEREGRGPLQLCQRCADERDKKWMDEMLAQYHKEQQAILSPLWAVGFKDRGMGHGDFAVILDGTTKVVVECPSKEIAEHIVRLHNQEISDAKTQAKADKGKRGRQPSSSDRKPRKR